jgi:hypothetical protein
VIPLVDAFVGLEALSRYLNANGWKNRLEDGVIRVEKRKVSHITMKIAGSGFFGGSSGPATVRVGPVPVYASQSLPVQLSYALPVDPAKEPEAWRAKLDWDRSGILWTGDIVNARFEGGAALVKLNEKPDQVLALARNLRRFEKLWTEPDVAAGELKVVHQQKMKVKFSLLGSELFDVDRNLPPFPFFGSLEWLTAELAEKPKKRAGRAPKRCRSSGHGLPKK